MRTTVLTIFASVAVLTASPAHAETLSLDTSAEVASAWIFEDQAYVVTDKPVYNLSADLCAGDACLGLWHAQAFDDGDIYETDITVSYDFALSSITYSVQAGYYIVPGEDIWEGKLTASVPVAETCEIAGSVEVMRGGFKTRVIRGEGSCAFPLGERLAFEPFVSVSHDTSIDGMSVGYGAALAYDFGNGITAAGFVQGFTAELDDHALVGLRLARSW